MPKMKKKIFLFSIAICIFAGIFYARRHFVEVKKMPLVETILPEKGRMMSKIMANGNVEAQSVVRIDAPISGKIQLSKNVQVGSIVRKGEPIILITPDEESIKIIREGLDEMDQDLHISQKKYGILKESYESGQDEKCLEINLEKAKRKYDLAKRLYELGVIAYQELETEEINLLREESSAKKQKQDALASLEIERLNIIKKENQVKRLKEQLISKEISAKFDGVITKVNVKNDEIVVKGYELITLANPEELIPILKVSGENIGKIKVGQKVVIKKEYYSTEQFSGRIEGISMVSEEEKGVEGGYYGGYQTEKDYFKVMVRLDKTAGNSLPFGINKRIYGEIILEEKDNAIKVPYGVIRYEDDGKPYLFLYREKVVRKQAITLGIRSEEDEFVEVLEGVDLNEKIIGGVNLELKENQRVEVNKDKRNEKTIPH
jgi:multidrug resistance efflux pump